MELILGLTTIISMSKWIPPGSCQNFCHHPHRSPHPRPLDRPRKLPKGTPKVQADHGNPLQTWGMFRTIH